MSIWDCRALSNDLEISDVLSGCTSLTHVRILAAKKSYPNVFTAISLLNNVELVDISRIKHCSAYDVLKDLDVRGLRMSLEQWETTHEQLLEFSDLQQLEILGGWGHSRSVPIAETLGKLTNLQYLRLSLDSLYRCSLPSNFFDLNKLKALTLDGTFYRFDVNSLVKLTQLRVLDVSKSNIVSLPQKIHQLQQLIVLDKEYQNNEEEQEIPESLSKMKNLKYLGIDEDRSWEYFVRENKDFIERIDVNVSKYNLKYSGKGYEIQYEKDFFNSTSWSWCYKRT